ncbi:hypothetical protein HUG15_16790 [Salicibibacter cibarius]|uniref:Uncharacterized protein n=1 Tax=Salicibibacter cibarius TaxID=2743000 RepID=A0A7T7CCJ7_9BACI|nr:hypothetical protein [Salicibibacter cibarius]QQK77069.1 hypothetical protein HUG15_16790 [Salicibibacter cibarius]
MTIAMPTLVQEKPAPYFDHDGLWKKVITDLFEPFMLFFAPDLYEQLDWSKQPDSLEQELKRSFPDKTGTKYTDKLMKVHHETVHGDRKRKPIARSVAMRQPCRPNIFDTSLFGHHEAAMTPERFRFMPLRSS